jgi:hypothetical protein
MRQRLKTVYKIVRTDTGGSALASISFMFSEPACTRYTPQKWVRAPKVMRKRGYDLCVFDSLESVHDFINWDQYHPPCSWQVWKCDAIGVRKPVANRLFTDYVTSFVLGELGAEEIRFHAWPTGTLFATAVRLIEPVPWDTVRNAVRGE